MEPYNKPIWGWYAYILKSTDFLYFSSMMIEVNMHDNGKCARRGGVREVRQTSG